ncbi:MAG: replicative DNA helicase [Methylobacter sp.]|jgi:replicative DNA helicase
MVDRASAQLDGVAVPPHSIVAEQGVIGGLMLDPTTWVKVQGLLTPGDFYRRDHQLIFKAIAKLHGAGEPIDVITLYEYLKSKWPDDAFGGLSYLGYMAKDTPSAANIAAYAKIVRDKSMLRRLIAVAGSIREMAFAADADAKAVISKAETAIFEMAQQSLRGKKGFTKLRDVLREVLDTIELNVERPSGGVLGISSGFKPLDDKTSGFNGGDLIVLAARPSMGKTALAMNMAESAALDGKAVAVFSMEMQTKQLGQRLLSSASGLGLKMIRESWRIGDSHWPLLTTGVVRIGELPMYIDDSPGLSIGDIRSRCMRLSAEIKDESPEGVGLIVIDYLQLMGSDTDRLGNRNNEIEDITRGLKRLAKDFDIPVIVLSQLNRGLESRPNKRPIPSDLRDSGGIEQDADVILFLYRDEVYSPDSMDKGIAEVIIGKQRNGPLGTVRLLFDGHVVRFRHFDEEG